MIVEVVYAGPSSLHRRSVVLDGDATVATAIDASGIARELEIDLKTARVGIYGRLKSLDSPVRAGDRVEIYRPLIVDPMVARRRRIATKKASGPSKIS